MYNKYDGVWYVCVSTHVQAGVFACVLVLPTECAASLFGLHLINACLMRSSGHAVRGCSLCSICQTN